MNSRIEWRMRFYWRFEFMKLLVLQLLLFSNVCFANLITVAPLGNTESSFPFGLELANVQSMRYQQVYEAVAFSLSQEQQAGFITEIRFYSDENNLGGFTSTLSDVQIDFSITFRAPDQLSSVFAENLGINTETVFGRGEITLAARLPGFAVSIPLDTPYFYDPSLGNLLVDIRNHQPNSIDDCPFGFGDGCAPGFNATYFTDDAVSSVYSSDVHNSIATGISSVGLVTTFNIEPIPEPSTWALLGLGMGMAILLMSKCSKKGGNKVCP